MKCDLNYMEPFSRVYNHHGFQTGIIGVEPSDYEFLYMRYIQIYFSKSNNILEYGQDYFFENDNAFVKAFFSFPAEYWIKKLALADLQALINDGFYISGMWDEATVPGAKHYGKKRYWHNYMIIGYDEEEANFTCVGYDVKGQWERYKINYDVFITVTNENPIVHFEAIKRNSVFYKKFQLSEVKESMNTLLKGGMKKFFSDPEPCMTGLDACREFLEFEKLQGMNKKKIHEESFYLLKESKEIMCKRLLFIKENGYAEIPEEWIIGYQELEENYNKLLLLVLKYKATFKNSILERIYDYGMSILDKETFLLNIICENL